MTKLFSFLGLWLFWGFTVGTLVLLGPLRATVDYAQANDVEPGSENAMVIGYMVLVAAGSFAIAFFSNRKLYQKKTSPRLRTLLVSVPLVTGLLSFYLFLHPNVINGASAPEETLSMQERDAPVLFTLGAYPDEDKMIRLRKQGYTHIVSLLHAAVPFETKLLQQERENAYHAGLQLTNLPMLPWISSNEETIRQIRQLVHQAKGRYYIHCYQGRDRANVVRRIISQESGALISQAVRIAPHSITSLDSFERGAITRLDSNTFLTPRPTEEEYFGYVIAGDFKSVVILSDKDQPYDPRELEQERSSLSAYGIPCSVIVLSGDAPERRMRQAVSAIRDMPHPVLVHARRSNEPVARLVAHAYGR